MSFDPLALTYDRDFTASAIARFLRARVHARLDRYLKASDCALELGCGTGEDALHLAERGVRVLATDASPAMLEAARAKTAGSPLVSVAKLDLKNLTTEDTTQANEIQSFLRVLCDLCGESTVDGVYANFGVLNCVGDWRPLAAWLAARVRAGGVAAFGVMSRVCAWEMAWHGLHGDFATAGRRLRGSATFQPGANAEPMPIFYPSIKRLTRDFAPYFRRVHVEPLGLLLPPSDVYPVIERRPGLLRVLIQLEGCLGCWPALAALADHYWIEFERVM